MFHDLSFERFFFALHISNEDFIWYYSSNNSYPGSSWTRKIATEIASFKLWPLSEMCSRRTMGYYGGYSWNNAHAIILKRWKWLGFVYIWEELLVNRTATLLFSSSRWRRPKSSLQNSKLLWIEALHESKLYANLNYFISKYKSSLLYTHTPYRCLDILTIYAIDNPELEKHIHDIYAPERQLDNTNISKKETHFLDLNIEVINNIGAYTILRWFWIVYCELPLD